MPSWAGFDILAKVERKRSAFYVGLGFRLTSFEEDEWGLDDRLKIPKCSYPIQLGKGWLVGRLPLRVSESKGQPSVVVGLPRLGTN